MKGGHHLGKYEDNIIKRILIKQCVRTGFILIVLESNGLSS